MINRFTKFVNMPELSRLLGQVSVFYAMDRKELPEQCDYRDCIIEKSKELSAYMLFLYERTQKIRAKQVAKEQDNMLKVSTDGRKAALHMRLVGGDQPYDEHNKLFWCAENVTAIYEKDPQSTQLIFCDISTPKNSFNIYQELSRRLKERGIPAREIAFIHSYKSEESRKQLFDEINMGKIRVLIGSTFKLGIGANVQSKLKAIHHLDVPWRPADMVQREGRILRRGNENDEVYIYRYITKGSFDAYSWQILENKQKFISQFLSGTEYQRTVEDLENQELTYAQVKALALAQPLMKEYTEKMNELRATQILLQTEEKIARETRSEIAGLDKQIAKMRNDIMLTGQNKLYEEGLNFSDFQINFEKCVQLIENKLFGAASQKIGELAEFHVYTPEKQSQSKPYLCFERLGIVYFVEFGNSKSGNMTRLKNFLKGFDKILQNFRKELINCENKKELLEDRLREKSLTAEKIKRLEKEVQELFNKIKNVDKT